MNNEPTLNKSLTDWSKLDEMEDEDIDFSDCPEITPEMLESAIVKPGKKSNTSNHSITVEIDPDMVATNPVQIFIAHASEDKPQIRELYNKLKAAGYRPWLDEEDLIPGQNWREEIPKALKNSDLFLACLSSTSISKRGYIQREFKMAMEMLAEFPPGNIYLIPLKLDNCQIPDLQQSEYGLNLRDIQWLDYYQPNGFEKLIKAIEYQFGKRETMGEERKETMIQNYQRSGDNMGGNKTVNNYYAANNTANTNNINTEAIELWKERLAYFQHQEAIASDPAQKFQLKKQIQQCQQKIQELGG